MKKSSIGIIIVLIITMSLQQVQGKDAYEAPTIEWDKTYGGLSEDVFEAVIKTRDGGLLFVGATTTANHTKRVNNAGQGIWLVKTKISGEVLWEQFYDRKEKSTGLSVIESQSGGYIVAGTTSGGNGNAWIIRTDSAGTKKWDKTISGLLEDKANCVRQTVDGFYIIGGIFTSESTDVPYYNLIKMNEQGAIVWKKYTGGEVVDFQILKDGNMILAGLERPSASSYNDYSIAKVNNKGEVVWHKVYGGTNDEVLRDLHINEDGSIIVTGYTESTNGDVLGAVGRGDIWVLKISGVGEKIWQKVYGELNVDNGETIFQTADGGYIVAGSVIQQHKDYRYKRDRDNVNDYDFKVIKTDSYGNIQWQANYGGTHYDELNDVIEVNNGEYIVVGLTESDDDDISMYYHNMWGGYDAWIAKLTKDPVVAEYELTNYQLDRRKLYNEYTNKLSSIDVFVGTRDGYEVNRPPTRLEALVMLIRMLGKEEEAMALKDEVSYFTDIPEWGIGYANYAYQNGLTKGIAYKKFGANDMIDAAGYSAFMLRALGYDDGKGDFEWSKSLEMAKSIGLINSREYTYYKEEVFLRGDLAIITYDTLNQPTKGNQKKLVEKLVEDNALNKDDVLNMGLTIN